MRKHLFLLLACLATAVAYGQDSSAEEKKAGPEITFENRSHDFGDIVQGDKVEYTYHFSNTGNEPLIISSVQASCGCTVPKYSRDPVAPGEKGEITVVFNSAGKSGRQNKPITITSNAINKDQQTITFTTNVLLKNSHP